MHMQSINMEKVMSGATQSVVEQLTNKALKDVKLRGRCWKFVKKYMKMTLFLFKEEINGEIPHTTKFEKLID